MRRVPPFPKAYPILRISLPRSPPPFTTPFCSAHGSPTFGPSNFRPFHSTLPRCTTAARTISLAPFTYCSLFAPALSSTQSALALFSHLFFFHWSSSLFAATSFVSRWHTVGTYRSLIPWYSKHITLIDSLAMRAPALPLLCTQTKWRPSGVLREGPYMPFFSRAALAAARWVLAEHCEPRQCTRLN